jgi:hypothetical protein
LVLAIFLFPFLDFGDVANVGDTGPEYKIGPLFLLFKEGYVDLKVAFIL